MAFAFCSTTRIVFPRALRETMAEKIVLITRGARPIEGSSSMTSSGRDMRDLPIASICCSPPDRVPASWRSRSLEPREELEDRLEVGFRFPPALGAAVLAPDRVAAELEVLADGHGGEELAPLGTREQPRPRIALGPRARDVLALEESRCRPWARTRPARLPRRVDLPAPFAPMIATISPGKTWSETPLSTLRSP